MFVRLNKKYFFLKAFSLTNFQNYNSPLPNALFVENALICNRATRTVVKKCIPNFEKSDNICKFYLVIWPYK